MPLIKSILNDFSSGRLSFRYCCNYYWRLRKLCNTRLSLSNVRHLDIYEVHSNILISGMAFKIVVLLGVGQPRIKFFSTSWSSASILSSLKNGDGQYVEAEEREERMYRWSGS